MSGIKFPFDKNGLMHYNDGDYNVLEWKDYYEFEDALFIERLQRGRSSVIFILRSLTNNLEYPMFVLDFYRLLKNINVIDNAITGKWGLQKKGKNYGIFLVNPK
jgi:hypothetical protein